MRRLGLLKPGMYPRLRLTLFCGEALPLESIKEWAVAAPRSTIENIYGPTELTIACTAYCWDGASSPADCEHGVVPIGQPFEGMEALIVNEDLAQVQPGADGELLMTGPQLSLGYWKDEGKTQQSFVIPPGRDRVYYRTGDRVRRPLNGKPMVYLGRMDNQIKILGHRVELGEVEGVVREESGIDGVVAIGWPKTASGADGIEVFLQTDKIELAPLESRISARLPAYMAPRRIHCLARFPVNANGKFDRKALTQILEQNA
jgi:acyl-coenzyme A synthetase/AMP-(fatty) acid ligase